MNSASLRQAEVRFSFIAAFGLEVPLTGQGEAAPGDSAGGLRQLGVAGQPTHTSNAIQHIVFRLNDVSSVVF